LKHTQPSCHQKVERELVEESRWSRLVNHLVSPAKPKKDFLKLHQPRRKDLQAKEFKKKPECHQSQNPINEPLGKGRTILVLF